MVLNYRRILAAAICAAVIKIGIMDLILDLNHPLGLSDNLWVTIIYMSCFLALGFVPAAWRKRRQKG
jgi:hypothetical protein